MGDVAHVPRGSPRGDDHVIGPIALVAHGDHPHVFGFDVAEHLLHLAELKKP